MKREVNIALSAILVVAIALVTVYYFSPSSTGFAVFNQQSQSDFNGTYDNVVYDANLSAIVLQENQTVGTYTSQIFDASNDSLWNNLTWVGTGDLSFEVRACGSSDCVNDSTYPLSICLDIREAILDII